MWSIIFYHHFRSFSYLNNSFYGVAVSKQQLKSVQVTHKSRGRKGYNYSTTRAYLSTCRAYTLTQFESARNGPLLHVLSLSQRVKALATKATNPAVPPSAVINEQIPYPIVRVVDSNGMIGDMSPIEGTALAVERQQSLILIQPLAKPPVCRIGSLDEHCAKVTRAQNDQKHSSSGPASNQYSFDPALPIKTLRMSGLCADNDLKRKLLQARSFLSSGNRVHIELVKPTQCSPHQMIERMQRICGGLKDISIPVNLPSASSLYNKLTILVKFWPCTPEQAEAFSLPSIRYDSPEAVKPANTTRRMKKN